MSDLIAKTIECNQISISHYPALNATTLPSKDYPLESTSSDSPQCIASNSTVNHSANELRAAAAKQPEKKQNKRNTKKQSRKSVAISDSTPNLQEFFRPIEANLITTQASAPPAKPSEPQTSSEQSVQSEAQIIEQFQSHVQQIQKRTTDQLTELLYLTDEITKRRCLIDSGSKISAIPKTALSKLDKNAKFVLKAANSTTILTYGQCRVKLKFAGRIYRFVFVVADVSQCILGLDFLTHFRFVVDPFRRTISNDQITFKCSPTDSPSNCLQIDSSDPIMKMLNEINKNTKPLPNNQNVFHYIHTTGEPCKAQIRHFNPKMQKLIKETFDEYLAMGFVRHSSSEWSSPLVIIKKADSYRVAGDYRALNLQTINDSYPLPYLNSFNSRMAKCRYYTKLDLRKAYYHILVYGPHICKTALLTPQGLFEWVRLPLGLKTAGQSFMRFIDQIFRDFYEFIFIFVDDIVVYSETEEQHLEHLRKVFTRLAEHSLTLNLNKCVFNRPQIDFLGYQISCEGIKPSADKVKAITDAPIPTTIGKLKRFLGTVAFYHHCVPNFASIRQPLNHYLSKEKKNNSEKITLNQRELEAYHQLTRSLAEATTLAHPRIGELLVIHSDASDTAMGGTLSQMIDGEPQPLYFFSHLFDKSMSTKSIYHKELEAAYQTIKKVEKYLIGEKVVLYTDNEALARSIAKPKDKTPFEARRLNFISQYIDEVVHIPSERNPAADHLSRLECNQLRLEPPIDYPKLFEEQQKEASAGDLKRDENRKIKRVTYNNKEYAAWFYELPNQKDLLIVPHSMVEHVISAYHNLCHPGQKATVRFVANKFFWPTLKVDCRRFVKYCERCQAAKKAKHQHIPISRIECPANRFEHLNIDLVGPLPVVDGYMHLLTIIDRNTRFFTAIPIKSKSTKATWTALLSGWIQFFGLPKTITTDRGANFTSNDFKSLCAAFGIHLIHTSAYHPKSNGLIENFHLKLKSSLRALKDPDWLTRLPLVILSWNNAIREDGLYAPSQLVFGSQLVLPGDFVDQSTQSTSKPNIEMMRSYIKEMNKVKPSETNMNRNQYKHVMLKDLQSCEFVWELNETRKGLESTYKGPYEVLERSPTTFKIMRPNGIDSVATDRLRPAYLQKS